MAETLTRVAICEDESSYRKFIADYFVSRQRYEVRSAPDPEALITLLDTWKPDIVLFDLYYDQVARFDAIRDIRAHAPAAKIVPLTSNSYEGDVKQALDGIGTASVDGYITKDLEPDQMETAIAKILNGQRWIDPDAGEHLARNPALDLTGVERAVLQGLADGKTHAEIAKELPPSERTGKPVGARQVRRHEGDARRKLVARNTHEAIANGFRRHILR